MDINTTVVQTGSRILSVSVPLAECIAVHRTLRLAAASTYYLDM